MPFSREKFEDIQRAIRLALASTGLNDWERTFLRDVQAKLDRFGPRTSLSDKQYRQLMKLTRKYAGYTQHEAQPLRASRKRRVENRSDRRREWSPSGSSASRRKQSRGWQPSIGPTLAAIAVGLVLIYKGAERFPEYLGPVVAVSSIQEIVGRVTHVRDGDTIEVSGIPIRFGSLDCAESGTSAGERATARMRSLVAGQTVTCYLNGRTSYDRKIGSCRLRDGRDLGAIMIREGYCGRFW